MTLPLFPNRSSSDDDALDHQLNKWATGSHTDPASDEAADALEFHRWADNTRRSDPAATGPAAGTWNRVLRNSAQESSKRSSAMSSATLIAQSPGFSRIPEESFRQRSGRYATLAATVAIVLTVAFGGWLAMSQMPGGGGDGRFAAIQGTPTEGSDTCEVEPLTVDRVMEIVNNPIPFMANGATGEPTEPENSDNVLFTESQNAGWWNIALIGAGPTNAPSAEDFEESSDLANAYINCVVHGTVGQIWTFYSPAIIQTIVLDRLPVFATENEVRAYVTERVSAPADEKLTNEKFLREAIVTIDAESVTVNPDSQLALQQSMWGPYESVITFGIQMDTADGKTIYLTSATGSELVRHPSGSQKSLTVSVGIEQSSGNLVVFPYAPISFTNK